MLQKEINEYGILLKRGLEANLDKKLLYSKM